MAQQTTPWRHLREAAGLSLREAARRANISPAKLSNIETGFTEAEEQRLRRVLSESLLEKVS